MQMPQEPADRRKRISRDEIRATIAAEIGSPVDGIADDDDLIRMGLNSIRMMALAGRWRMGGARITFAELAAHPTVASWHELLSDEIAGIADPSGDRPPETVAAGSEHDPYPLAAMQHAYWIGRCEEQELGGVAAHLYVEFDGQEIDPVRLQAAVTDLVAAHPMLRTRFLPDGRQQTMPEPGRPVFSVVDLRGQSPDIVEAELAKLRHRKTHQRLAVQDAQVIDVTLTLRDQGRSRLHLDVDMLAADAMSYRVLVSDLSAAYRGAVTTVARLQLPSLPHRAHCGPCLVAARPELVAAAVARHARRT